jgi:hypothetical protein
VVTSNDFLVQVGLSVGFSTTKFLDTIKVRGEGLSPLVKSIINGIFSWEFTASVMVGAWFSRAALHAKSYTRYVFGRLI